MLRIVLGVGVVGAGCTSVFGLEAPARRSIDAAIDPAIDAAIDTDGDEVPDDLDNCDTLANDQTDSDGDDVGDACDVCPEVADDQHDEDGDHVGDVCDNCPTYENEDQANGDTDGLGDRCDLGADFECVVRFDGFGTLAGWTAVRGTWAIDNDALVQTDAAAEQTMIVTDASYNYPRIDTAGSVIQTTGATVAVGMWATVTSAVSPTTLLPDGIAADLFEMNATRLVAATSIANEMATPLGYTAFPMNVDIQAGSSFVLAIALHPHPSWGVYGAIGADAVTASATNSTAVPTPVGLRTHSASARYNYVLVVERRSMGPCPSRTP